MSSNEYFTVNFSSDGEWCLSEDGCESKPTPKRPSSTEPFINEMRPGTKTVRIAVFGTLKKGYGNHRYYLEHGDVKFIEERRIDNIVLYDIGAFFPGSAIEPTEKDQGALCEIYEIPSSRVRALDGLEGVPSLYRRYYLPKEDVFIYIYNNLDEDDTPLKGNQWPALDKCDK